MIGQTWVNENCSADVLIRLCATMPYLFSTRVFCVYIFTDDISHVFYSIHLIHSRLDKAEMGHDHSAPITCVLVSLQARAP